MGTIDPEQERKRLVEVYAGMADDELEELAKDLASLTDVAQRTLQDEIARRTLTSTLPESMLSAKSVAPEVVRPPDIEFVVVFATANWVEGEMVACALEGHEIPTLIIDDNVCRILPQAALIVGGVKVIARFEHLTDAADVLQLAYSGEPPFVGGLFTIPLSLPAALIMWLKLWGRRSSPEDCSSLGSQTGATPGTS